MKKIQKKYKNIIVIDKENEGLSMARNRGVQKSNGKYIIFVDSDDYVSNKLYKEYLAKIVLTTEELKNKDMERNFFNQIMKTTIPNYYDTEEEIRGKSR